MKDKLLRRLRWLLSPPPAPPSFSAGKKRCAFVTKGGFSYANSRILEELIRQFPEYEVESIDVSDLLQQTKLLCFINIFVALWEYPREIFTRIRPLRECFYLTDLIFDALKRAMAARVGPGTHEFTLQTQSLHDFSVPGVPHFVYTDHVHLANLRSPAFDPNHLLPAKWIEMERSIYENASRVFVMTHLVERTLLEVYKCDASKVICVPAGYNTAIPTEIPPEVDANRQPRILFVGVNWKRKGGPQLLDAFLQIVERFPQAKLVIVGCNPAIRHPNVEVCGKVRIARVEEEYRKAQFLAFPTRIEPMGFVVIEALMHKLPVIGTPIGILPDIIHEGENGYLVAHDDTAGLAKAMAYLLANPQKCRQMGEEARRVASGYTWEASVATIRKEVLEIIEPALV